MRAGSQLFVLCWVGACGPQTGEPKAVPRVTSVPAPTTASAQPESRCTAGAAREADDGCNACSCSPEGHWMCGDLPCPGCREPYTGTDAAIAPNGGSCDGGEVWERHPEARLCCRYSSRCTGPASWEKFPSEAACRDSLGGRCTPGERLSRPSDPCDQVCSPFGMWQRADCRARQFFASIQFGERSSELHGSAQRELDNFAGLLVAHRVTRLTLESRAVIAEATSEAEAKALGLKRARAVRDALTRAGVSGSIFELLPPTPCFGSSSCRSVNATTEGLTNEQLEAGYGHVPRWKTCEQDVVIRTAFSVRGDEGVIGFELCRNDKCSRFSDSARSMAEFPGARGAMLQGALNASLSLMPTPEQVERNFKYGSPFPGSAEFTAELHDRTPAAELAQGDRYRVALYRSGRADPYRLLEWKARYTESFPNGPEHDPVPCRLASVDVPLRSLK